MRLHKDTATKQVIKLSTEGDTMRNFCKLLFLLSLLMLVGCQSALMQKTAEGVRPYTPDSEKATVIFMRPSSFGAAIQSTVYKYDTQPNFIGIVSANTKIAYQTDPGKQLFMVVGENADFLEADLLAGHIYYVEVEAHFGFAKARFSLEPIPQTEFDTEDFKEDIADCNFVENTPASENWFTEHRMDIIEKYDYFFPKWQTKDEEDKNKLGTGDGRPL